MPVPVTQDSGRKGRESCVGGGPADALAGNVAGRSLHLLTMGLAQHGAEFSDATLTGVPAQAGSLLGPLQAADHRPVVCVGALAR
jgi:hypothetical protein